MDHTILLLSLAVATTQAQTTFNPLKHAEVFSTVASFFSNIRDFLGRGPDTSQVQFSAEIAFDQIGKNNKKDGSIARYDPTGFLPMFYVYGPSEWVAWTNGFDYIKNGEVYMADVKDNGQLCFRDGSGALKKCANSDLGDGDWTLHVEDSGVLLIKNMAGQFKWSNQPYFPKEPTNNWRHARRKDQLGLYERALV
ncbi:hypothetical protein BGZ82_003219 [Podila clonocystis]|nr:hypothetical protein BGZ82_003219 [Podila clonocystis]